MIKGPFISPVLFVVLVAAFASLLIFNDAFEWFHDFSRAHEDWELDEIILTVIAALIVGSVWFGLAALKRGREIQREAAARLAAEQELSAARHVQSLGVLAGGLAHSGNNFLQPIVTLSRLGREQLEPDHPVAGHLEKISSAADKAADLFTSVLRFSRPQSQSGHELDVIASIHDNLPILLLSLPSGITLEQQFSGGPAKIRVNEQDLIDILLVLMSNAADAYGGGAGTVWLRANVRQAEGVVTLMVADHGAGMSAELQQKIFDPFFTTKEVGKGTGLGLSVVSGLVKNAGGKLGVESAPGQGAVFSIDFPIVSSSTS